MMRPTLLALALLSIAVAPPVAAQSADASSAPATQLPALPPGPPTVPAPPFRLGQGGNPGGGMSIGFDRLKTGDPLPETRRFIERRFLKTVHDEFRNAVRRRKFESSKNCKGIYSVVISPHRTVWSLLRTTEDDYWPMVQEAFDRALGILKEEFPDDAVERRITMRFGKGMLDCRSIFPFRP